MSRPGRWCAFAAAVAVHLAALYWPRAPSGGEGLPVDKPVHALLFGVVLWAGAGAGLALSWTAGVLAAHSVISEVVQHVLMAHRSGDPLDTLADLVGLALAVPLSARRPGTGPDRARAGVVDAEPDAERR